MKTRFINFGGGLITGLCLFLLLTSAVERSAADLEVPVATRPDNTSYVEVPLKDFLSDVARYNKKHAEVIALTLPTESGHKISSRMFIYSLNMLEDFFTVVKRYGKQVDIPARELAIRFYYGVYPIGQTIKGQNYSSLHTIFMVPNVWSAQEKQYIDFDIKKLAYEVKRNRADYKKNKEAFIQRYYLQNLFKADPSTKAFMLDASAVLYSGDTSMINKKASVFPTTPVADVTVINQGQLCPPNCPRLSLLPLADATSDGEW